MASLPQIEPAVRSQLWFLKRDELWETEKPYRLRYVPVDKIVATTNFRTEEKLVQVYDARPLLQQLSLDTNGFEVHRLQSRLGYDDFSDYDKVTSVYMAELAELVKTACGAKHAKPLDYELRKRHETFPVSTGDHYAHAQPALLTHVDVTQRAVEDIVREIYPTAAEEILKGRVQCITAWKPLRGPVEDWPLALCDARSLQGQDMVPADAVYQRFVAENVQVHHSPDQRWFYVSRQEESEVLLFKAVDSDPDKAASVAHGAMPLPVASDSPIRRESIDVRVLVMHADIEYPQPTGWST